MPDVLVVGAGLAGLSAARDLARGGADVLVLEARDRPGGRVEQVRLDDGRLLQLGGEVVGEFHTAYLGLVDELGLTVVPSYVAEPGQDTWGLTEGVVAGDMPWLTAAEREAYDSVEAEFAKLAATVDPEDPWGHPEADRLDGMSLGDWLRARSAPAAVLRALEVGHLALSCDSVERTSLLAELRKEAAAGAPGFYESNVWESLRVAEGSATVAVRMADELGERVRYGAPVAAIDIARPRCSVILVGGETLSAEAVVSAIPAGPLRDVRITGVSDERLASLHRQRHALAAKVVAAYPDSFWRAAGRNGLANTEYVACGLWPQGPPGVLSGLVPPERLSAFVATAADVRREEILAEIARVFGGDAPDPDAYHERIWGLDPWAKGYVTGWRLGDVMGVGPLHGTHEPPFYVCGSDQWVAGYMEGAVRTGRSAAAAALGP